MQKPISKKLNIYSKISEITLIFSSVALIVIIYHLGIIPTQYFNMLVGTLVFLSLFFSLFAFLKGVNKFNRIIQSILCTVLSMALIITSIGIKTYEDKIKNVFTNTETVTLYIYALKDSAIETVDDLGNTSMGLSPFTNENVQKEAFQDLVGYLDKYELGKISTTTYSGILQIVDALYNHEVDSIMLQSNLLDVIEEVSNYIDFETKVKVIYESTHKVTIKRTDDSFVMKDITKDPFIIAVGGRDLNGHFDVNMVVAANPVTKQVLIVTIPRDAYSPLDGDPEKMDKLSYTGKLSSEVWLKTLQLFFDYRFNFYSIVDFYSISDVIDAIGGIDLYNPYYFSAPSLIQGTKKFYFSEGNLHLGGMATLAYCRERQNLPKGDLSRNEHQGIVLKALIKKLTSKEIINKADNVLSVLQGKVTTDFTLETISKLINMQLIDNADWNIVTYNLSAELFYTYSYMIGHEYGPNYAMMDLDDDSLAKANSMIKQVLDGEVPYK